MSRYQLKKKGNPWKTDSFDIVAFTIGTKVSNVINVGMVLTDSRNQAIAEPVAFDMYLSGNANGLVIPGTAPSSATAIGTNGTLIPIGASAWVGMIWKGIANASGDIDINLTQTVAGNNYWLVITRPDGTIDISPEISF